MKNQGKVGGALVRSQSFDKTACMHVDIQTEESKDWCLLCIFIYNKVINPYKSRVCKNTKASFSKGENRSV